MELPMQDVERCPICGSELSQTKFREIRARQRELEDQRARQLDEAKLAITRDLEKQFKAQFEQDRRAAEKKAREHAEESVRKALAERDQIANKLKEAAIREDEIKKQAQLQIEKEKQAAARKAKADAELELKKVAAERDTAAKGLKEAEARLADVRKRAVQDAEKQKQKELVDQRQVLEKAHTAELFKKQSEFNRRRESLEKKLQVVQNQLQQKTANELGDGGEIDVFEAVREAFDGSGGKTTRVPKGQCGADLLHEVFYRGESCGRIIIDAKNRQGWKKDFVTKLRQDQVAAGAEHAILPTTAFPAGKREICIDSDVIVISPAHVVHIVRLLRQAMIMMHVRGLSMKQRAGKMNRLYDLMISKAHTGKLAEAARLAQDLLNVDVEEKRTHDNVWKKRGILENQIRNVLREYETDVAAVIECNEDVDPIVPLSEDDGIQLGNAN
jgi:hypothetical protein